MNITIFGANGQIGQQFIEIALQNGDQVKAIVRREGALEIEHPNLEVIKVDLKYKVQVSAVVQGQDAVVSALGPHLKGGRKIVSLPIKDAHEMIVKVMEETGVKRLVTLATPAIKAKEDKKQLATVVPSTMPKLFSPPAHAEMMGVKNAVITSSLDWTIVRIINPNIKTDGDGYTISFGDTKAKFGISRKNAAKCMYDAQRNSEWIGKMPIVFNK